MPNPIEKFLVQERAGDDFGSSMEYNVVLEQETKDVLEQGAEVRQKRSAGFLELPQRGRFRAEIVIDPAVVGIVFDPRAILRAEAWKTRLIGGFFPRSAASELLQHFFLSCSISF